MCARRLLAERTNGRYLDSRKSRSSRPGIRPLRFEPLEARTLLSAIPNDPDQFDPEMPEMSAERWHHDITDAPEAWAWFQDPANRNPPEWGGRDSSGKPVIVAVTDSGIDYTHPDLYLNIWINPEEIPASQANGGPLLHDPGYVVCKASAWVSKIGRGQSGGVGDSLILAMYFVA